jgi:hypothetical protein
VKPAICASPSVAVMMPSPTANRSPVSTAGRVAVRAAANSGCRHVIATTSAASSGSGIPGIAISPANTARATSTATITVRRGYRSASPASSGAVNSGGSSVSA